jgi:hypothetical protein
MLTKEAILDCYFKENNTLPKMQSLIQKYQFYFQEEKKQPENLICGKNPSEITNRSDCGFAFPNHIEPVIQ